MEDEPSSEPRSPSRIPRILGIILGGVLVLLVVAYFVISSSAFIKGVILPRVSKAVNADVTVADASLSPFSSLSLTQLKVQPAGVEPLLTADRMAVRYSLFSILRGDYVVNELVLTSPIFQVIREPTGARNLDPLLKGSESKPAAPKSSAPLHLSIHNVSIKNAVFRMVDKAKDGSVKTTQVGQLDLTLDRFENAQPGKLELTSGMNLENRMPPGKTGTNDVLQGKVTGSFGFTLDPNLLPQSLTGSARLDFSQGAGAYAELAGLSGAFQADMTPTEIRQLSLRFERAGQGLGRVQVTGPLELAKSEGRVKVEVQSIDRQVLNLFGASHGWDFANSTLNSTNLIDLTHQGDVIGAKGQLAARQLSIRQQGQSTPPVDLDLDYELSLNRTEQTAVLSKLNLAGVQQNKEFLRAGLDRPMTFSWSSSARGFPSSTFQLTLSQLDLKNWQTVLGTNSPSGQVDLRLSVIATNDAKLLMLKGTTTVQNLSARVGTNQLDQANVTLDLDGSLEKLNIVTLKQYQAVLQQANTAVAKINGSARVDLAQKELNLQANLELALPAWLRQFPVSDLTASNGVLRLSSTFDQKGQKQSLTGNLLVADFTGRYGSYSFPGIQAGLDYAIEIERPEVRIRTASLNVRQGYSSGGSVSLTGNYDLDKHAAQLSFNLVDLNQVALGPILTPALGEKRLVSVSLSGSGSTSYNPAGDASIKADLSMTNLVVADARTQSTSPPLGLQAQLDGAMRPQLVELRKCVLKLSPTARAKNELEVQARFDLAKTNAAPGQLTVHAESLDLTPAYDLLASKTSTNAPASRTAATPALGSAPNVPPVEPGPATLPFQQGSIDVILGQVFLREVAITNLHVAAKVNQGEITLQPLQLFANGGQVDATGVVNLSVPGYTYDVSLKADRVPMEPLANSFSTNPRGSFKGNLIAQAQIKGAGITDLNLKKNLAGSLFLNLTNLDYEIVGAKIKRVLEPIALVLRVPELTQTPLNWIQAKADVGQGQIDLKQFIVLSQAFTAQSQGTVPMADVLTNSPLKLPVTLALRRSLSETAKLASANAPTNTDYVPLPTFVTLTGTLGDPRSEINKLVIGGLLARSIGSIPQVGGKAGTILQGLGTMLTGQPAAPANTNGPAATNANTGASLVEGVSSLLSRPKAPPAGNALATNTANKSSVNVTNKPAANAPNKPAKPTAVDILNSLFPEKK